MQIPPYLKHIKIYKMFRSRRPSKTSLSVKRNFEGETIEMKVRRYLQEGSAINDTSPLIFTERSQGVLPDYNIRTDKLEAALEAADYVSKSRRAKRGQKPTGTPVDKKPGDEKKDVGGAEPIQGTQQP